jgi:hypothetical protein
LQADAFLLGGVTLLENLPFLWNAFGRGSGARNSGYSFRNGDPWKAIAEFRF